MSGQEDGDFRRHDPAHANMLDGPHTLRQLAFLGQLRVLRNAFLLTSSAGS